MERITVVSLRGGHEEARHHVHAVAVSDGRVVESRGDPELVTFFRSSAKPIQALPIVRTRADLDDAEIAIACASHLHRPDQLEPVQRLLTKADATEDDLECGPEPRLEHTCSGKHAAMLLLCRERGWPTEGYRLASHPCQREMLAEIAATAEVDPASMPTAIDGCGVVTCALPLERMAHAFSQFTRRDGGLRVAAAMRTRVDLISGAVSVDRDLMLADSRWVAKYGAEGLLCAVSSDGVGIALKVEDGAHRPLAPALASLLERLGFESGSLAGSTVENSRGEIVGELRVHRTVAAR